jgi:phosphatidylethanolamine-binding protein (PEBP) family uncharacterized protein
MLKESFVSFYIGTVYERDGQRPVKYLVRFLATDQEQALEQLESIAATFYGNIGNPDDDGHSYHFNVHGRDLWVSAAACRAVSEETYRALEGMAIDQ